VKSQKIRGNYTSCENDKNALALFAEAAAAKDISPRILEKYIVL
jgi:hypothetical protein